MVQNTFIVFRIQCVFKHSTKSSIFTLKFPEHCLRKPFLLFFFYRCSLQDKLLIPGVQILMYNPCQVPSTYPPSFQNILYLPLPKKSDSRSKELCVSCTMHVQLTDFISCDLVISSFQVWYFLRHRSGGNDNILLEIYDPKLCTPGICPCDMPASFDPVLLIGNRSHDKAKFLSNLNLLFPIQGDNQVVISSS